jgi:hypothetical protein
MASGEITLAPCLTCSKLISVEESACPNCGLRNTEATKREMLEVARFQARGNRTLFGLWIASRVQETNNWREWLLSNVGTVRDLALVAAAVTYAVGFIIWAIHAWNNDLGLLPTLDSQYIIAGLPPILLLSLAIVLVYLSVKLVSKNILLRTLSVMIMVILGSLLTVLILDQPFLFGDFF